MPPTFRPMTAADIPFGMRLKTEAGWNQTEADWRRFLALSQGGTLVAERDGAAVGTVATFLFGPIGWVAMLLVGKRWRHQGIGGSLLQCAVALLKDRGASTIRLDATPLGRPMYADFGFQAEYDLWRFEGTPRGAAAEEMATGLGRDLDRVCRLDRQVTGTDRRALLAALAGEQSASPLIAATTGDPAGYLFTRPGSRAVQIGPAAARDAATGARLLNAVANRLAAATVLIDIPEPNAAATRWAEKQGLVRQRVLTRMRLGQPVNDRVEMLWASSGPEKG
ncbi:MAG: GNAT family N-acetyltransferase [Pirellulaceae bacterium]|jgi:predicted N-acetyltransferase YhbS|nr:GNAT family N-acetyltransferase [Planctomycetota bacterium]NLZ02842.1 GNAT family N-acetyltransferase [Pirellulaceae bacterium]